MGQKLRFDKKIEFFMRNNIYIYAKFQLLVIILLEMVNVDPPFPPLTPF